jgi:hypothetical protein
VPFEPDNPKHLSALDTDVCWSKEQLRPHCERLYKHKAQYVGSGYGNNAAPASVPINVIELGVNTLQRLISPHSPQVMVGSRYRELLPQASNLELAINQEAKRIKLGDTFNTWAIEALFVMGVVEVGIVAEDTPDGGNQYDPGHLFVDPILFNRLILDMRVGDWDRQGYMGHEFDVPLEWAVYNPQFDRGVRAKLKGANKDDARSTEADFAPEQLALDSSIMDGFEETITLRQLYLPRQKLVLTFPVGQTEKRPLRVPNWEGPHCGMYHPLCFGKVPGSLIPNAPVPQWGPLHDMINKLWNKAASQAERQKTVLLVSGQSAADASRIVPAKDGEAIYSDNPKGCIEHSYGGADEKTLAMVLQSFDRWNLQAGNIMAIGGLGVQSDTVGQDRLLKASASGRTDDMQQIMLSAQTSVFEGMAWWLWHDPVSEFHLIKTVEGTDYPIASVWTPEDRQGDFTDYNFSINPYSAQPRSPQEESSDYIALLQLLAEMMPLMEQQGMTIDMEYVAKRLAKLRHMPDLARSLRYIEGEQNPERGPVEKPRMPTRTSREYVRRNIPQASQIGHDQQMASFLFGKNTQQSEKAGLMRTAS